MDEDRATSHVNPPGGLGTFHILGVPIRFHFTFIVLLVFLLVAGLSEEQSSGFYALYVLALFASVILHELGHALAGKQFGIKTLEITVFPIGGISRLERTPPPRQEFWIALAGPAVNFAIAGVLLGVLAYQHGMAQLETLLEPSDSNLLERIAVGNLILAVFNLLPAFPMDGGRMLRSALSRFYPDASATRMATMAGRMLALGMAMYGLLTPHFLLVFVAFFVYLGAAQEGAAAMGRHLTNGIPVRAAMVTEYKTLTHGNTVRDAANLLLATTQQDFPVVHGDQVIGLLGRSALLRAMAVQGPEAYVAGVMDRNYPTLSPDMDLAEVLPMMAHAGACALVMQGERLLGLMTSENVSQFLLLRRVGLEPTR